MHAYHWSVHYMMRSYRIRLIFRGNRQKLVFRNFRSFYFHGSVCGPRSCDLLNQIFTVFNFANDAKLNSPRNIRRIRYLTYCCNIREGSTCTLYWTMGISFSIYSSFPITLNTILLRRNLFFKCFNSWLFRASSRTDLGQLPSSA